MNPRYTYGSPVTRILRKIRFHSAVKWVPKGATILDIGSGIWSRFEEAVPAYKLYVSNDINPSQKKITKSFKFVQGDFQQKIPEALKRQKFDTIVCLALLEHLKQPNLIVKNASKLLNHKGRFLITTPNANSLARKIHDIASKFHLVSHNAAVEHETFLSKDDLYLIAKNNGLKVIHYQTFLFSLNQLIVFQK